MTHVSKSVIYAIFFVHGNYTKFLPVWGSLRLAPIKYPTQKQLIAVEKGRVQVKQIK